MAGRALFHILIVLAIVVYAVVGYRRGFVGQCASLLGMGFGIVAAALMPEELLALCGEWVPDSGDEIINAYARRFVPPAMVYLLLYGVFYGLSPILRHMLRVINNGLVNSLAGGLFGIFKTLMIVSILLNLLLSSESPSELIKMGRADDANLTEETMLLAPALLGTPTVKDLALELQLREAKKIS